MKKLLFLFVHFIALPIFSQKEIPLPEHPRPDFERKNWQNLNGSWAFAFDKADVGIKEKWFSGAKVFSKTINVPFPWGSSLSGVDNEADIAWYNKQIKVDKSWKGKRIYLTIGASDYKTTIYFEGKEIGSHEGGYTPFSMELTENVKFGTLQNLTIRVDDERRQYALYGKQGYGDARGIWQTVYLEAKGSTFLEAVHFSPDIDNSKVKISAFLNENSNADLQLSIKIKTDDKSISVQKIIPKGQKEFVFEIPIPKPRLWKLTDPFLYETEMKLGDNKTPDEVKTYFGMRKISVINLPNTDIPYIALNNEPIYLQLALDQSYHPEGFYTFPTDEFMKNEILLAKNIGLNGIRTHIKIDIPRKLYWADKLGLLIMSDLPNFWGEPSDPRARNESETTLKEMIKRDFNHPSIFSWITFNESWGLISHWEKDGKKESGYLPETQKWVASVYRLAKSLDKTRLVEDNSICCGGGHTETDINSWHEYKPGYEWDNLLKSISDKTFTGSEFHYEKGYTQKANTPNINSECGNVWGYTGSTGDVDWSWDYHKMMNSFRRNPKIAGWLYTEHHDVINEWNGYWRFDRTKKETGLGDLVNGMSLNDFHSDFYISTGGEISKTVKAAEEVKIPMYASFMTGRTDVGTKLNLEIAMTSVDVLGIKKQIFNFTEKVEYKPWLQKELTPISLTMPDEMCLVYVSFVLKDAKGNELHHNQMSFEVEAPYPNQIILQNGNTALITKKSAKDFSKSEWSGKQWAVLDGLKINNTGYGFIEYKFSVPKELNIKELERVEFIVEASAKELFVKDMDVKLKENLNYMLGAKAAPSQNPNAYPMTDETTYSSAIGIFANGELLNRFSLPDDPADHRGVLSWHNQPRDNKLYEAGSYGYLLKARLTDEAIELALKSGEITIRLEVDKTISGGLAIYGSKFGRFPVDPCIIFVKK